MAAMKHPPAYKGASQQIGLWFLFSFVAVASFLAAVFFSIHIGLEKTLGAWTMVPSLGVLAGVIVTAWIVTSRRNRQRIDRVSAHLRDRAFQVTVRPAETERTDFAAPLAHLFPSLDLRYGATGIQWTAVQQTGGVRLFEHLYMTGSGKTLQEHYHTVIAWPEGHPELGHSGFATAPWFFMAQYNRFMRREVRKRELQDPKFADLAERWSLIGDAGTAVRFLSPRVQVELQRSPKQETWCMGAGFVCCMFKGVLDVPQLEQFLNHARTTLAAAIRE
jgi:hypothetical protein